MTTRPKTVFHLINGEHYSGAERVQDLLAARLPQFGYRVEFGCLKPGLFQEKRKYKDAPVHHCEMKHRFDFFVAGKVAKLIRECDAQVIHAHTPRTAMVAAAASRRTGIPFVYHVHSPTSRDSTRWLINQLNQFIEARALKKAEKIITVSSSLKDHISNMGFPSEKIIAIPNGVPVVQPEKTQNNAQANHAADPLTIGTVALFRPRKGTEVLIEALAIAKADGFTGRILAVGPFETPEYENRLKQLSNDLGVAELIEWRGFVDHVADAFNEMDLFVLPSLFGEGLPMVVLEAMANGVPVIASDVEGIPQAIGHNKEGIVVPPSNAGELAHQIQQLANDPDLRNRLASAGQVRQREYFSDHSMARSLAQVYDELEVRQPRSLQSNLAPQTANS